MPRSWVHQLAVAGILYGFWVVLSGRLEPRYLAFGAASALGITFLSSRFLFTEGGREGRVWLTHLSWGRVALYIPWLGWEIVKANLVMIPMILGPRSRLRPRMITVKTGLSLEVARVTLANSITMTPGTLTVDVSADGEYLIHAIDRDSAEGVQSGRMEEKVSWAFDDPGRTTSPETQGPEEEAP
jgi:multicomponent Na+:H+ antiporter subunit E